MCPRDSPGLYSFLEEAAALFELHIYTMGNEAYARRVTEVIDPQHKYFGERILSRDTAAEAGGCGEGWWWCCGAVVVMLWWCCGGAVVVLWWCCGGAVVVLWWCCGGAVVVLWWCCGGAVVVLRWCCGGAVVVLWWCCDGAVVVLWWCWEGCRDGVLLGVLLCSRVCMCCLWAYVIAGGLWCDVVACAVAGVECLVEMVAFEGVWVVLRIEVDLCCSGVLTKSLERIFPCDERMVCVGLLNSRFPVCD